ncbi:hypothetical protein GGF46_003235 [Coemansia sp. RSA 552]|nr:hypothetical protein GGF46_003235 [Coemansia sp. RSA 552]
MKIHCIVILDRQGNPIYLHNFDQQQEDVKYHYLAHTYCDVIDERIGQNKAGDLYLGLLQTVGDMVVYGYVMNTGKKIILVSSVSTEPMAIRSAYVKEICQTVHAAYVAMVCNPFKELQDDGMEGLAANSRFVGVIGELGRLDPNQPV